MPYNQLHAFIETCQPEGFTFQTKNSLQWGPYQLQELPLNSAAPETIKIPTPEGLLEATLDSQHLSFFKKKIKGEYHYTGYYKAMGRTFRTHVYFNKRDQLNRPVELSEELADGTYKPISGVSPELKELITSQAKEQTQEWMLAIRTQHYAQIAADIQQLKLLEREADKSSMTLDEAPHAYLAALSKTITFLEKISPRHYKSDIKGILSIFYKLEQSVRTGLEDIKVMAPAASASSISLSSSSSTTPEKTTEDAAEPKPLPMKTLTSLINEANEAYKNFNQNLLSATQKVSYLHKTQGLIQEADILSSETDFFAPVKELLAIRKLMQDCQTNKQKLLEQFLFAKPADLENADYLLGTNKDQVRIPLQLKTSLLKLALKRGDAALLDFMLTHFSFPINTLSMSPQTSLVAYCFKNQTLNNVPACLSVLLKHGASLMEISKDSQLPYICSLLGDEQHPLRPSLFANSSLILENREYIKSLAFYLDNKPANHPSSNLLNLCRISCRELLEQGCTTQLKSHLKLMAATDSWEKKVDPDSFVQRLKSLPSFQKKLIQAKELQAIYYAQLGQNKLAESNKHLGFMDSFKEPVSNISFEKFQYQSELVLDKHLQILEKSIELHSITQAVTQFQQQYPNQKPSRKLKQQCRRGEFLSEEIPKLKREVDAIYTGPQLLGIEDFARIYAKLTAGLPTSGSEQTDGRAEDASYAFFDKHKGQDKSRTVARKKTSENKNHVMNLEQYIAGFMKSIG